MLLGRPTALVVAAALALGTLLAQPALAADRESGTLSCKPGQVVVITERTSAGLTTVTYGRSRTATYKRDWSTTVTRTGLQATSWVVTTSGAMDHEVTGAACVP
ncbi:MAG TPA: hypothetical protein VF486_01660 [Actinomycetes bacterium]